MKNCQDYNVSSELSGTTPVVLLQPQWWLDSYFLIIKSEVMYCWSTWVLFWCILVFVTIKVKITLFAVRVMVWKSMSCLSCFVVIPCTLYATYIYVKMITLIDACSFGTNYVCRFYGKVNGGSHLSGFAHYECPLPNIEPLILRDKLKA
jgi:hypothetical protein